MKEKTKTAGKTALAALAAGGGALVGAHRVAKGLQRRRSRARDVLQQQADYRTNVAQNKHLERTTKVNNTLAQDSEERIERHNNRRRRISQEADALERSIPKKESELRDAIRQHKAIHAKVKELFPNDPERIANTAHTAGKGARAGGHVGNFFDPGDANTIKAYESLPRAVIVQLLIRESTTRKALLALGAGSALGGYALGSHLGDTDEPRIHRIRRENDDQHSDMRDQEYMKSRLEDEHQDAAARQRRSQENETKSRSDVLDAHTRKMAVMTKHNALDAAISHLKTFTRYVSADLEKAGKRPGKGK